MSLMSFFIGAAVGVILTMLALFLWLGITRKEKRYDVETTDRILLRKSDELHEMQKIINQLRMNLETVLTKEIKGVPK